MMRATLRAFIVLTLAAGWSSQPARSAEGKPGRATVRAREENGTRPPPVVSPVPPPRETPAVVVRIGRTTTIRSVAIAHVGEQVPMTFSGDRVGNTPGFTWYVSQHYAFKTDFDAERARFYLELLELSYPHYVYYFGGEPVGIRERRMTVVYASNVKKMLEATTDDGFTWKKFSAGGITQPGHNIAYQYPSGGMANHKRYILIHECTHLYQYCMDQPGPFPLFTEGIADITSHHIYDPASKSLTVGVLDKGAIKNALRAREGLLASLKKDDLKKLLSRAHGYDPNSMLLMFLTHTPEYMAKLRIQLAEKKRLGSEYDRDAMVRRLYGPLDETTKELRAWVAEHRKTFDYRNWAFEPYGSWLWSRKSGSNWFSRVDISLPPGDDPSDDAWRMDYARTPPPPTVGVVKRGLAEPSVGFEFDLSKHPTEGRVGVGFGVVERAKVEPLPADVLFRDEAGEKPGLTLTIHELQEAKNRGATPDDVVRAALLSESVAARIDDASLEKALATRKDDFVAEWRGWMKIDVAGRRSFGLASDDGGWFWIGEEIVVCHPGFHGKVLKRAEVDLSAGMHEIRAMVFQGKGGYGMDVGLAPKDAPVPGMLRVLVVDGRSVTVDGEALSLAATRHPLSKEMRRAMSESGHRLGMNFRIAARALEITCRAGGEDGMAVQRIAVPLSPEQRTRLLERPMSLLSRYDKGAYMDTHFGIHPFVDAGNFRRPDVAPLAPPNIYAIECHDEYLALEHAAFHLGGDAPDALCEVRAAVAEALSRDEFTQRIAARLFRERTGELLAAIDACAADRDARDRALALLFGASLHADLVRTAAPGVFTASAALDGLAHGTGRANVEFEVVPAGAAKLSGRASRVTVIAGAPSIVRRSIVEASTPSSFDVVVRATVQWRGRAFELTDTVTCRPGIMRWWVVGPFACTGAKDEDPLPPESEPFDPAQAFEGKDGETAAWRKVERHPDDDVAWDHVVSFNHIIGPYTQVAAYAFVYVDAERDMDATLAASSEDGFIAWVNGERVLSWLGVRSYRSRSDQGPVKLKSGRNTLLIKTTLGSGGWAMGAMLLDGDGRPLEGVRYSLE